MCKHVSESKQAVSFYVSTLTHALSPAAVKRTCERGLDWVRQSARVSELKLRAAMWGVISYLNSPELVVGFQRCCGLVLRETRSFNTQNGCINANGSDKDGPVTIHRRKGELVANGTSRAHDSNSNYKCGSSQNEIKVSKSDLKDALYSGELKT